ncbi:MAG: preprotein translocase subunit SecG [Prevotellaceae bacterium]|jgi:preprotein translocase subunit SecG|nr:preprotein translocase subunit SecG [Prevotellaceae bacterium]
MFVAICVLLIIASILLVLVVLVQNSKGGGLAANFAAGNQTFGVRQTADYLEKATWTLAIVVLILCLAGTVSASREEGVAAKSAVQQQMQNVQPTTPGSTMPFPIDPSQIQEQPQEQTATPAAQPTEKQPE